MGSSGAAFFAWGSGGCGERPSPGLTATLSQGRGVEGATAGVTPADTRRRQCPRWAVCPGLCQSPADHPRSAADAPGRTGQVQKYRHCHPGPTDRRARTGLSPHRCRGSRPQGDSRWNNLPTSDPNMQSRSSLPNIPRRRTADHHLCCALNWIPNRDSSPQ